MGNLPPATDHWIVTARGRLFARMWSPPEGEGGEDAVLLLHDSLGCVQLWREFPERLAAATGRRVVAYDRLGFGRSDARTGALPRSFIVDEADETVPAVCASLELGRIVLFGHSVGGAMAIVAAARWPERCAAVVTESAQSFVEERTQEGLRAARAEFAQPGQMERLARYHGDKAEWVLRAWIETWLDPEFAAWRLDDALRQVRCPVLALHGDRDEYGSLEHPRRIAGLTQGRAVILRDCGHVPHREQPVEVLTAVREFLEEAGRGSG